jgi:hypothetical protein
MMRLSFAFGLGPKRRGDPGHSPKDILKMSTGFGAGLGLYGDTCGALIGAEMAVGSCVLSAMKVPFQIYR